MQTAALLVLAVPVMFDGTPVSIIWACLALAFAMLSRNPGVKHAASAAVATWLLAAGHLWFWEFANANADIVFQLLNQGFEERLLVAWALVGFGQIIGWLIAPVEDAEPQAAQRQSLSFFIQVVSGVFFIFASILWLGTLAATTAIITYAWVMALLYRFDPRVSWLVQAWAVLALALVKWVVIDTLAARFSPAWSAALYQPVLNPQMAVGGLIAISIVALGWLQRDAWAELSNRQPVDLGVREVLMLVAGTVVALLAFALSLEIDRVVERASTFPWPPWQIKHLAWTMLWVISICCFAVIVIRVKPLEKRRETVLGFLSLLMMMLTIKFLLMDTLLWRLQPRFARTPVVANLQVLTAIILVAGMIVFHFLTTTMSHKRLFVLASMLVVLWAGSFEIDRAFFGTVRRTSPSRSSGPCSPSDRLSRGFGSACRTSGTSVYCCLV